MGHVVKLPRKTEASKRRVDEMTKSAVAYFKQRQQEDEERAELESFMRRCRSDFEWQVARMDKGVSRDWAIVQLELALEKLRS